MEASLAVAVIQVIAVMSALWLSGRRWLLNRGLPYLVSLAVGVLLATALLHILPEAVSGLGNRPVVWITFATTIFAMFCIERVFTSITGHAVESPTPGEPDSVLHHPHHGSRPLSLIVGGMLHSFVDGISVAAAFAAGHRVGWLTAAAITLHEVPHRLGDYAVLMHLHVPRRRAVQLILMVALAAMAGVFLVLIAGHTLEATDWLLPVSAGSFVYIALVNLMPELVVDQPLGNVCLQLFFMLVGAALVALLLRLPHG